MILARVIGIEQLIREVMKKVVLTMGFGLLLGVMTLQSCEKEDFSPNGPISNNDSIPGGGNDSIGWNPNDSTWNGGDPSDSTWNDGSDGNGTDTTGTGGTNSDSTDTGGNNPNDSLPG